MKALIRMMSEYNRWANNRLIEDCACVSVHDLWKDLGAEYRSIHGTLDHGLLVDRLWLARFSGLEPPFADFKTSLTTSFEELTLERSYTDEDLDSFIDNVSEAFLLRNIEYTTFRSTQKISQPLGSALLHLFHHQSHYRAQVQAFLQQFGKKTRTLDLLRFQRLTMLGGTAVT
ncbi:DinB family protein [Roseibium sp.]|uniref:DinB family protein n=1 Tax=Roseibium sp. TaxID=1936156 RepID=UPI003A97D2F0